MDLNNWISLAVGVVAPLLVSIIRGKTWPDWLIMLTVLATAVALSTGVLWITNSFTSDDFKESIALMLATMFPVYNVLWEKTQLNKNLKKWNPISAFFKPKKRKYTKRKPRKVVTKQDGITIDTE